MSEAGFCSQHGVNRAIADKVPDSLFAIPKVSGQFSSSYWSGPLQIYGSYYWASVPP